MSFKFNASHFHGTGLNLQQMDAIIGLAQAALDAHVATLPVVYSSDLYWGEFRRDTDRRSAVLFNVQAIAPKDCEHEPDLNHLGARMSNSDYVRKCLKCGVKLKAKWEVCE